MPWKQRRWSTAINPTTVRPSLADRLRRRQSGQAPDNAALYPLLVFRCWFLRIWFVHLSAKALARTRALDPSIALERTP